MSRPARALWIEIICAQVSHMQGTPSRPARALWIEIWREKKAMQCQIVEAREGLVD